MTVTRQLKGREEVGVADSVGGVSAAGSRRGEKEGMFMECWKDKCGVGVWVCGCGCECGCGCQKEVRV